MGKTVELNIRDWNEVKSIIAASCEVVEEWDREPEDLQPLDDRIGILRGALLYLQEKKFD